MAANFGTVLSGTAGGMLAAGAAFYFISIRQMFGGVHPVDQNDQWQVKTEDLQIDGKWQREAAGTVHMNPIKYKISGREYALNAMKPRPSDDDDEGEDEDEDDE